ncbi:unnamed protein product [Polarella glacialis]|uniref:Tim44-like domain-containing protein n=2 Tax=Polarella glacialis TaxID=89957 RepID=A0A813EZ31_POLGL|nr:unnamed protein product [Polarella glacialis]|mmetsp:Transcript_37228/g.67359  ORF Transcript_37228/g.67359 Transcript_37228/m.67359 type:complete len:434 (+) Transcript_37228:97-1398(+)
MQARAAAQQLVLRSRARGAWLPVAQRHRNSSFIKQVMEQVKKDMEADEKLKKDWEKVSQTSEKVRERSAKGGEKLESVAEGLKSISSKTSELLSSWKERTKDASSAASSRLDEASEQNEALKKAREFMKSASESGAAGSRTVMGKTKNGFSGFMDVSSKAFAMFGDEHKKAEKTKQWAVSREAMKNAQAQKDAAAKDAADKMADAGVSDEVKAAAAAEAQAAAAAAEPESGLVVSKASSSSWDRFGSGLRDMPFLSSVFENPLFDRVFGESEIAASIREMKDLDYTFRLEDLAEDMEYVVAPQIIQAYLDGDQEALKKHCGDAAFVSVNASIKERIRQKLSLDTNILAGPKEMELKGAKLMEQGAPCFIFTFNMQQVNCLRDGEGEILEGAVDDIRNVCYAMAVTRHPNLENLELEYPWQVSELAILWNQPCF